MAGWRADGGRHGVQGRPRRGRWTARINRWGGGALTITAIDTQTPGYAEAVGRVRQIMDPVAAATPAPVAPPAAGRAFADTLTAVMPAPAAPAGHPAMSLTLPAAAPPLGFPLGGPAAVGPVAPVAAGGS